MRLTVTFFILLLSFSACKKGGSQQDEVDPREQYVGTYDVNYTSKTVVGTITVNGDSGKGSVTFEKGSAANEMNVTIAFPGLTTTDVAKLNGSQFTLGRSRDQIKLYEGTYEGDYIGTGSFEGNSVTITAVTKAATNGTAVEWTRSYKGTKR